MALAAALASRDTPSVRLPRRADTRPRRPPRPLTYIGAIGQYIKPTPSATPGAPRFWEIQRKRSEVLLLGENKAVSDGRQPVFFPLSLVGVILRRRNASATNSKRNAESQVAGRNDTQTCCYRFRFVCFLAGRKASAVKTRTITCVSLSPSQWRPLFFVFTGAPCTILSPHQDVPREITRKRSTRKSASL